MASPSSAGEDDAELLKRQAAQGKDVNSFVANAALAEYLHTVTNREHESLSWIRKETQRRMQQHACMLSTVDEGRLLTTLAHMSNAKLIVEIGVFTGYSSTCFVLGMGQYGRIVALDISEEFTSIAREAWKRSGIKDRIELRLAPALDTLKTMTTTEAYKFLGKVDLVFIDADKGSQAEYYEYAVQLVRSRGIIVVDNTLWYGMVIDKSCTDDNTAGIREANEKIANDNRVVSVQLPFADGVTIVSKK